MAVELAHHRRPIKETTPTLSTMLIISIRAISEHVRAIREARRPLESRRGGGGRGRGRGEEQSSLRLIFRVQRSAR